jgi:ECF transporter S component (folate family)
MQAIKDIKKLTMAAMLLAVSVILSFFKVPVTNLIEIRFNSLPIAAAGYLFGPVIGGLVGMLADILGYIVKPTGPFFPGFTISSTVTGVIYGMMLWRREVRLPRLALAEAIQTAVVSIFLNSYFLSILYGSGFFVVLSARLLKSLVMYPVNLLLLYSLMKPLTHIGREVMASE